MSRRRRSQPEPAPARFLLDRSLGHHIVAGALRAAGLDVITLADHYGEQHAQQVPDEQWLSLAGQNDWIVLHKDDRIRRRPAELAAIQANRVRVFCITNANLTGPQMAERYLANLERIERAARRDGPYVYGVYEQTIIRLWP